MTMYTTRVKTLLYAVFIFTVPHNSHDELFLR